MFAEVFRQRFLENSSSDAMIWHDQPFSYEWLARAVQFWRQRIDALDIHPQTVCALESDFSPNSIALFLALVDRGAVIVPLTQAAGLKRDELFSIAEVEVALQLDENDHWSWHQTGKFAAHQFYTTLRRRIHPGLVLFSSGSTGKSKAAVHDLVPLLKKFETRRKPWRAISFLLYDHIGGLNTMLFSLSNGGCLVTVNERTPDAVLAAVERHRVELLPASPTFLNLILISEAWRQHDLSSLQLVTYGTEPMPESTLRRFHEILPHVRLQQTYGLSELGILRSKSLSSDSLWVKIGGDGFEWRVVDNILQIRAASAMLGYLNAPSPFTADGWFDTRDRVEQDGEYLKILGRESEIINVGGEKVYPNEVESVIQEVENVAEVVVFPEANAITGHIVCARVTTLRPEDQSSLALRIKKHCAARLQRFKVPARVLLSEAPQHNARFKRIR
jgi:acyl-CoA synthetase (AMP-forming)/AMP-acid ligase II